MRVQENLPSHKAGNQGDTPASRRPRVPETPRMGWSSRSVLWAEPEGVRARRPPRGTSSYQLGRQARSSQGARLSSRNSGRLQAQESGSPASWVLPRPGQPGGCTCSAPERGSTVLAPGGTLEALTAPCLLPPHSSHAAGGGSPLAAQTGWTGWPQGGGSAQSGVEVPSTCLLRGGGAN